MSEQFADFEALLQRALAPVEPPEELEARLERTLGSLVDRPPTSSRRGSCRAMRDPRNWVAPGAPAAAVGSGAAVGLVLRPHPAPPPQAPRGRPTSSTCSSRTLRDLAREARRVADDVF